MNRKFFVANAVPWAAAIVASAIVHAPVYLGQDYCRSWLQPLCS
jgi:hypothetical protein